MSSRKFSPFFTLPFKKVFFIVNENYHKRFCIQSRKSYLCHLQKGEKCVERVFEVLFKILFRIEGHKLSNQIACQMSKMGEKVFSFQIHALETENEIFPSDRCDQSV